MTDEPVVSVVVIFHDDERFLGEAIDSVLGQTFTEWELLLVDDGSTDGSTDIARRVAARQPHRVRYLEHPGHANRGISATRNRGIEDARGQYVAFLDSDDVWIPEKLEEQVTILEANPEVGLLFGASRYWWSWAGEDTRGDKVMQVGAQGDRVHHPPSLLLQLHPLGQGVSPCPSSCIASRALLDAVGGFEAHMPGLYDDQGFLTKAYLATPVFVSNKCWDRYRRHPDAITLTSSSVQYDEERRYFLNWFTDYLRAEGVTDPDVHHMLERAWWPYRHPMLARWRRLFGRARATLRRWLPRGRRT